MYRLPVTRLVLILSSCILAAGWLLLLGVAVVQAGDAFPVRMIDQTPTKPLGNPITNTYEPRYVSGFGTDDVFTVFFEDRDNSNTISFVSTSSGPTGFGSNVTATNIADTHFVVKDWTINITGTNYAYRAWASVGNNANHHFYVSNNLSTWTLVSTFTITNTASFTDANGSVYYGFHDVIQLNGTYYAFAESNGGQTMIISSTLGSDSWHAFDSVGGTRTQDGPLQVPEGISNGWTPTGSFFDLGSDRGYGKLYASPDDSGLYLAVNTAAQASLSSSALEAAFIDPENWTWHDGNTGPASSPLLSETSEHDLRECWQVPSSNPTEGWVVIYDADFGAIEGGKVLGYAVLDPRPDEVYVNDDWEEESDNTVVTFTTGTTATIGYDAFAVVQDAAAAVSSDGIVHVSIGVYTENLVITKGMTLRGYSNPVLEASNNHAISVTTGTVAVKGFALQNADVMFDLADDVMLTAYANNILTFSTGISGTIGVTINARHNWWGAVDPTGIGDADAYDYRLGAAVESWGEGSCGDATIDGGTGVGVIVNHGATIPFGKPTSPYGTPCSAFYDFFAAIGASGTWTVTVPVSASASCDTTFNNGKLFSFALDGSSAPDLTCSPDAACWRWYGDPDGLNKTVTSVTGSPRKLSVILSTVELGGTPLVAGDESGFDPTSVVVAESATGPYHGKMLSVISLLGLLMVATIALIFGGRIYLRRRG